MYITLNKEADPSVWFGEQVITEPSKEAMALNELYNGNIATDKLIALDIFIANLKKNNLWDKIKVLFVPSLFVGDTSSIKNAFIDVKKTYGNSSLVFGENADNLTDTDYGFSKDGLTRKTSTLYTNTGTGVKISSESFSSLDTHFLAYKIKGTLAVEDNKNSFLLYGNFNAPYFSIKVGRNNLLEIISSACYEAVNNTSNVNFNSEKALYGGGFTDYDVSKNTVIGYTINNSEIEYNRKAVTNTDNIDVTQSIAIVGLPSTYGLFSFGTSLSKEDATIYSKLIKSFMNKLL